MNITLYLSLNKERERAIGAALEAGFKRHGDQVRVVATADYQAPDDDTQMAVVVGIKGRSKQAFDDHLKSGRHALLVDKSYFGRTEYLRLSLDGFQPHYAHAVKRPTDRLKRLKVEFMQRRASTPDSCVIYAGSSQKYCDWHELGDATEYAKTVCHRINKQFHGLRQVLYRPKPSWVAGHPEDAVAIPHTAFSGPDVRLHQLLPRCHALVTHGSNAAVEAVMAGVPAVVISDGACAAERVAETVLENIWDPRFPEAEERRQWAANLAYCQFTIDEIADGTAWGIVLPQTWKGSEAQFAAASELERTIAQYRQMHLHPKMFRGRLADCYAAEIATLCQETGSSSLLDYGSGKGEQYTQQRQHERFGFPEPTCYDPGVPAFAVKPVDRTPRQAGFDGVLCLDVMEHVPEAHVDEVLAEIFGCARRFVYLVIFTAAARKHLPDGRNCHLTQRPPAWWNERIRAAECGLGRKVVVHFKGEDD